MSDAAADTPSSTASEAGALSSRAAALTNFLRRLGDWDFPADASLQISVVAGRSVTLEPGGPVIRQTSHADLFISAEDSSFIEAALDRLLAVLMQRAQRAAQPATTET